MCHERRGLVSRAITFEVVLTTAQMALHNLSILATGVLPRAAEAAASLLGYLNEGVHTIAVVARSRGIRDVRPMTASLENLALGCAFLGTKCFLGPRILLTESRRSPREPTCFASRLGGVAAPFLLVFVVFVKDGFRFIGLAQAIKLFVSVRTIT